MSEDQIAEVLRYLNCLLNVTHRKSSMVQKAPFEAKVKTFDKVGQKYHVRLRVPK